MLPDEKVGCHRTGFKMSCYDGVTKHKCQLWCHVSGKDHMDNPIDAYGCSDALGIKLLHEVAKEVRCATASTDKVANEVEKVREQASSEHVHMINGLKATLPVLKLTQDWEPQQIEDKKRLTKMRHGGDMTSDYEPPPDFTVVQGEVWQDPEGLGVRFTRPDGTPIFVNSRAIAFVRAPLPGEIGKATIVFSSGAKQAVSETVQQVIDAIHADNPAQSGKEPPP